MAVIVFTADRRDAGQTLAAVLKARYALSWAKAKATIERRHVRVAGQIVADAAFRVKSGKRITIAAGAIESAVKTAKPTPAAKVAPVKAKVATVKAKIEKPAEKLPPDTRIVYHDDVIVVVDKPAGLTTMRHREEAEEFGAGRRFLPKTLMDLLPAALGAPNRKLFAVHRLDRDTTGLVVFARTPAMEKALTEQFRKHTIERRYLAIVRGVAKSTTIRSTLVDDRGDGRRGSGADGKKAVTRVKRLATHDGHSLVECALETGRTHQVRIHLGEAGTPLCGERVYDRPVNGQPHADASGAARPMLHAMSLGLVHPETGDAMRWDAPPPADFVRLQLKLKLGTDSEATATPSPLVDAAGIAPNPGAD